MARRPPPPRQRRREREREREQEPARDAEAARHGARHARVSRDGLYVGTREAPPPRRYSRSCDSKWPSTIRREVLAPVTRGRLGVGGSPSNGRRVSKRRLRLRLSSRILVNPAMNDDAWRRRRRTRGDTAPEILQHRGDLHYMTYHKIPFHYITVHYIILHYITGTRRPRSSSTATTTSTSTFSRAA